MNRRAIGVSISIAVVTLSLGTGAYAQWTTSVSEDKMTGERSCYAHSATTGPLEKMNFPYGDVRAWLGVGCDGTSEWVYVGFSESPNLLDTSIGDGYNRIRTRIKWDNQVEYVTLIQDWGSKFLHFVDDKDVIPKIAQSGTVLLELNWYGTGKAYFRFSLKGSSEAIKKIRTTCGEK